MRVSLQLMGEGGDLLKEQSVPMTSVVGVVEYLKEKGDLISDPVLWAAPIYEIDPEGEDDDVVVSFVGEKRPINFDSYQTGHWRLLVADKITVIEAIASAVGINESLVKTVIQTALTFQRCARKRQGG